MVPLPPALTPEDRARAGAAAVRARQIRADLKNRLRKGEITYLQVIYSENEEVLRMRVIDLLKSIPMIGDTRAKSIMERVGISPKRRIAGLGKIQLQKLEKELLLKSEETPTGKLMVISGPGGVGKSTISKILSRKPNIWVSVSATTRYPRENEKDGVDYYFLTDEKFESMIENDEFLEWADFAGAKYGTPKLAVTEHLRQGQNVVLEIEIAGARKIRKVEPSALLVFIAPPSIEELAARLEGRGSDDLARRAARLALAEAEMAAAIEFDHQIVNTSVDETVNSLISLLVASD